MALQAVSPVDADIEINDKQERAVLTYAQNATNLLTNQFSLRFFLEEMDRVYMRENDYTIAQMRARAANRAGNATKIQDITVPIVMPQVEAAMGYFANVFLTGVPIFGVTADPANQDAAMMMETIIQENAITASWHAEFLEMFRDGLKYNLCGVEVKWDQRTVYSIEDDPKNPGKTKPKQVNWAGNCIKRLDMYNTILDPRVAPSEVYRKGEYAGYLELYSRIQMKQFINDLFGKVSKKTVQRAFESSLPATSAGGSSPYAYYKPIVNPYALTNIQAMQAFDWMQWAVFAPTNKQAQGIRYGNAYQVLTLYAKILPADFDFRVPGSNTPQVWKFIIVNNSVVLHAERLSNVHGYIPMFFGQPLEDGLDYQTKSFASNVTDIQAIASALWNGLIASKRRLIGDRVLYDPLRIRKSDIESVNPAAKIPVRPSAYGQDITKSVYAFPFRDDNTASFVQAAEAVVRMGDKINNQNPAQQGQFVKGNKTRHEYEDIMGHGNNHNQIMAMTLEHRLFTPVKEVLKLNILQYQGKGQIYSAAQQQTVEVNPVTLRQQAVVFKVSDGLIPSDKLIGGEDFALAMQTMQAVPAIAAAYNIGPMFSYFIKTRGADIRPFEKTQLQQQWDQIMAQWQQVAMQAIDKGVQPPPQPQMPPELIAETQQRQKQGGASLSANTVALQGTQGPTSFPGGGGGDNEVAEGE